MANDLIRTEMPLVAVKDSQLAISSEWAHDRDATLIMASTIESVTSQETYEQSTALVQKCTKLSNALENARKSLAKPLNEAVKEIKKRADSERSGLEKAKTRLSGLALSYKREQDRIAAEARRKKEAEERAQIAEQLAARECAEDLGIVSEAEPFEPVIEPVSAPVVQEARTSATSTRRRIVWSVADHEKIPRKFLSLDPVKVNGWIKMNNDWLIKDLLKEDSSAEAVKDGIKFAIEEKIVSR